MKYAKILAAAGILALASTPLLAQDIQLRMGGAGNQTLEVAPGVQLNMEKTPTEPQIQIFEINPAPTASFDEVITKLEAGVNAYLAKVNTAEGQAVVDAVKAKYDALTALEVEFNALSVKDAAAKAAFTDKLFSEFVALRDAVEAAAEFEADASKTAIEALSSANPRDLMNGANQAAITKVMEPAKTVGEVRKQALEEGAMVVQFVYQDSTPIYQDLVTDGKPQSQATSDETLKIYFGKMVDEWAK